VPARQPSAEARYAPAEESAAEERPAPPRLEMSAHVFAEQPGQSFVFINGQSYRAGQRIGGSAGPLVKEITPEGAVIDYGHGLLRLQAER
jgi:hypothetical protein